MPFEFFNKRLENDEIVERFDSFDDICMFSFFGDDNLIPLIYWSLIWDDEEVATLDKLENKKVWKYTGADNKKNYENNLKKQPENWYYRNNKVNYTLNSLGYRTKEFDEIDWENSIIMFGCSHVFCTGVDDKHTVSNYLEKITGKTVINMGIPGSSIFSALYTSFCVRNKFPKPLGVIFSWTSLERLTLIKPFSIESYGNWNMGKNFYDKYSKEIKSDIAAKNLTYIMLARTIWKDYCNYYDYTHFAETKNYLNSFNMDHINYFGEIDMGRDMLHHGPKSNLKIALDLASRIKIK